MTSWEERMGAKARDRREREERERWEAQLRERREQHPEWYSPTPPDTDHCEECFEWRSYPAGQEHFGYSWFSICGSARGLCDHDHHETEVWLASGAVGVSEENQ